MAVIYAIAILLLLLFGVNLLILAVSFANRDTLMDGRVPPSSGTLLPEENEWPTVTVQLPVYNERFVVDRLIDACARLDYPPDRLDIQVLDDSTDDTVSIAAERVGYWRSRGVRILHLRRSDRSGFKAGALQHGLTFSRAELVAVFDADFVPDPGFLRETVAPFVDPDVGLVQARWAHLNASDSLLTRIQAFGLDTHFVVEQRVRNATNCFINFNGTAGLWRRACIDDSGGWSADTLAEDLDLSYRAQLKGWKFKYLPLTVAPAELPSEMNAFRAQQFRWAKGTTQTAMKMLAPLWKSDFPIFTKLEGTAHLTAHLAFPTILLLALLHTPLLFWSAQTGSPGRLFFALLSIGFAGFVGFFVAQLLAQRDLYFDWQRRIWLFPVFMAGSMGLSLSNTRAVIQALLGRNSSFVRTPKYRSTPRATPSHRIDTSDQLPDSSRNYSTRDLPPVVWVELALCIYSVGCIVWLVQSGNWLAIPFQVLLAAGFGLVSGYSMLHAVHPPIGNVPVGSVDKGRGEFVPS